MKILFIVLCVLLFNLSCIQKDRYNSVIIDKNETIKIKYMNSIEQFVQIKRTIALHNSINSKAVYNAKKCGSYYVTADSKKQLYLSDSRGGFLGKIGKHGKGPGEYFSVGDIVPINDNSFFVYDNHTQKAIQYSVVNNKIEYIDDYYFKNLEGLFIDRIIPTKDGYYFFSFYGPKDGYMIHYFNREFKKVRSFHKRNYESKVVTYGGVITSDNHIFIMDAYNLEKSEYFEPYIYMYSKSGELIRKINADCKRIFFINIDRSQRFLILTCYKEFSPDSEMYYKVFDINGNYVTDLKNSINPLFRFHDQVGYSFASDYSDKIHILNEKGEIKLYEIEFTL